MQTKARRALARIGRVALVFVLVAVILAAFGLGALAGTRVSTISKTLTTTKEANTQTIVALPLTQTVTTTQSLTDFESSSHTFEVNCCPTLPGSFIVGNYTFESTVYAPPPCTPVGNGTLLCQQAGVLLVFEVIHGQRSENISFSWSGTFSETPPFPANATAFNGAVYLHWFANATKLYLSVNVISPSTGNYTCSFSGEPLGVMVHLVLSNPAMTPLSGVEIYGHVAEQCSGGIQFDGLLPTTTNSSGWATFRGGFPGNYILQLNYSGEAYYFTVPARPMALTVATYAISSGALAIEFCERGNLSMCSTG